MRKLVMRIADAPSPMETTYKWAPTDVGRMRMTLRNRGNPSGFAKLTAPVLERASHLSADTSSTAWRVLR